MKHLRSGWYGIVDSGCLSGGTYACGHHPCLSKFAIQLLYRTAVLLLSNVQASDNPPLGILDHSRKAPQGWKFSPDLTGRIRKVANTVGNRVCSRGEGGGGRAENEGQTQNERNLSNSPLQGNLPHSKSLKQGWDPVSGCRVTSVRDSEPSQASLTAIELPLSTRLCLVHMCRTCT